MPTRSSSWRKAWWPNRRHEELLRRDGRYADFYRLQLEKAEAGEGEGETTYASSGAPVQSDDEVKQMSLAAARSQCRACIVTRQARAQAGNDTCPSIFSGVMLRAGGASSNHLRWSKSGAGISLSCDHWIARPKRAMTAENGNLQ